MVLELVVGLVMAVGLVGVVFPLIPGLPLIWGAALAFGLIEGFGSIGIAAMALITLILIGGMTAKILVPKKRATAGGAPTSTLAMGALVGIVGFFAIPIVGLPLGAAAGVLLAEYRRTDDWAAARRSTKEVIIGFGIGSLIELGAGIAMVGAWVVWALLGN
ncbi:MAG: DUF456 domain-containing protein [Actinomycetota bacterium]|nr:DUF456 domain-containing protein [Actinomycetota bacterium]